jgi:hypothetical protein
LGDCGGRTRNGQQRGESGQIFERLHELVSLVDAKDSPGAYAKGPCLAAEANISVSMKPLIYVNAMRRSREFLPDSADFQCPPGSFG